MENMDIERIIDIPDTPDRFPERGFIGREGKEKENVPVAAGYSRDYRLVDQECCHYLGGRGRPVPEGGDNIKHHSQPQKNSNSQTESRNGLSTSGNAALFRRAALEKDKGKAICTKFPPNSIPSIQKDSVSDLNQRNRHSHFPETAAPKSLPSGGIKEVYTPIDGVSRLVGAQNSLKAAGNSNKGKEKIDDSTGKLAGPAADRERNNGDPQHKKEDRMLPIIRATGHRKLVRNGCISPHGIAARAKQAVEHHQSSSKDNVSDQSGKEKMASNDPPSIDIREIVAEDDISGRAKGKRPIIRSQMLKDNGAEVTEFPASCNGSRAGSRDTLGSAGWRSTRNRQMTMGRSHLDVGHSIGQRHGTNRRDENASRRTFSFVSGFEQVHELSPVDREAGKRQRRNGFTSAFSDKPENSVLGTSGESSSSRPSRIQRHHGRGMQNLVLDIGDSSPEVRPGCSQHTRGVEIDESDVRARQVEADEILARELQEQLYQEVPLFGVEEIDESVAWMLQDEENSRRTSSQNPQSNNPIPAIPFGRRRMRPRLDHASSRRGPDMRRPRTFVRTRRGLGHLLGPAPVASHRALNLRFPTDMALESRLDVLEELESTIGQLGSSMSRSSLLQFDRDFNEDDYEMLLALDENNHRHGGASVHQINSLPQSTVQTDNFEETCAVCLETPTIGDVIRHLPCLHKFHKDCIDPWLQRSKSCPVCKSSLTSSP